MSRGSRRPERLLTLTAISSVAALTLTACGGGTDAGSASDETAAGGGSGASEFAYLGHTENTTIGTTLETLAADQCADAASGAPFSAESSPGSSFDQKLQLLAGQDALPQVFMAAGTPALMQEFIEGEKLQDVSQVDGVSDAVLPAAASTIEALYGTDGELYALPTEFNIEGIWYNKQIFEENGLEVPQTWDEFVAVVDELKAAGVQPLSTPGKDGWGITRFIGAYLFRDLGPDALQKVVDGEAALTDPEYVEAAQAVADLGAKDAWGPSVGSIDYNTALNQFLTGEAAMIYMGSWALSNWNDPEQNQIGEENVGFMKFPAVEGGAGDIDQIPANVGVPIAFSSSEFGEANEAWVSCIAENYGDTALADSGVITGFQVTDPPADLPPLTQEVQATIADATESVLWFEALFTPKATTLSQQNAAPLVSGQVSAEEFMKIVQDANAG